MVIMQTADCGIEAMGEYMLKLMSGYPGLGWDIILKQLCAEHRADTNKKIMQLEQKTQ